jgi:hypothetical protein
MDPPAEAYSCVSICLNRPARHRPLASHSPQHKRGPLHWCGVRCIHSGQNRHPKLPSANPSAPACAAFLGVLRLPGGELLSATNPADLHPCSARIPRDAIVGCLLRLVPAHHSERHRWLAPFCSKSRNDGLERTLARLVEVRMTILQGKKLSAILKRKTESIGHKPRAHAPKIRLNHRNHHAIAV